MQWKNYIDGQNPYMGTAKSSPQWSIDLSRLRTVMKRLYQKGKFDKIVLVSGDGDYKSLVDLLCQAGLRAGAKFMSLLLFGKL